MNTYTDTVIILSASAKPSGRVAIVCKTQVGIFRIPSVALERSYEQTKLRKANSYIHDLNKL